MHIEISNIKLSVSIASQAYPDIRLLTLIIHIFFGRVEYRNRMRTSTAFSVPRHASTSNPH